MQSCRGRFVTQLITQCKAVLILYYNKQLLDEVFVICGIINVEVRVISQAEGDADNSYTETLIILHITKTESDNCVIIHCKRRK